MQISLLTTSRTQPHRRMRYLLLGAFGGVGILLVALSSLGVWGTYTIAQRMQMLSQRNLPAVQAIANLRIALLTLQSDDRQTLFETNAAQVDADLDLLPTDEAALNAAYAQVQMGQHDASSRSILIALRQATDVLLGYQHRFAADLATHTQAGRADATLLEAGTGLFRQQGWVVDGLLQQLSTWIQMDANTASASVALFANQLFGWLMSAGGCALLLIVGLAIKVTASIGQSHIRVWRANEQLAELLGEVQTQNEEIQSQQESLLATNAELEAAIALRTQAETELLAALNTSQQTQSLLSTVCEKVHDGLVVFDPDGTITYSNGAAQQIMNLPPAPCRPFAHDAPLHQLTTLAGVPVGVEEYPTMRILRGEAASPPTNYHMLLTNGIRRVVQMESAPLLDASGTHHGALSVVRDITKEYQQAQRNKILQTLAHLCAREAEVAAIARAAVHALVADFAYPSCAIVVRDRVHEDLAQAFTMRADADVVTAEVHLTQAALDGLADMPPIPVRVLTVGEAQRNIFSRTETAQHDALVASATGENVIHIPIVVDQRPIGIFTLVMPMALQDADCDLVQALADELGIAFHRAQLYEDAQRLALRDPLTGLYNHRALQQMVQQHVDEALADEVPLSVIMLDVDHFRQFNEHAGHDTGDLALRIVAQAIQGAIRSQDVAARYGGEEFTVILPNTRSEHAAAVAERIRVAIASSRVPIQANGERLTITASLGVATLPFDASTPAALLKSADLALYAAKHQGRNQVSVYTTFRRDEALAS